MSRTCEETFVCHACGRENKFTLWQSLNGNLDPEAKQQLLNGTFFLQKCANCGHETPVVYAMLYNDMTHRVMVHLVEPEAVEKTRAMIRQIDGQIDIKLPEYRKRIVTSPNALREKAILFEHGLDDRVVEIIKLIFLSQAMGQYPDAHITEAYLMVENDRYTLQFIGDKPLESNIPTELYAGIQAKFAEHLEAIGDEEYVVDAKWAMNFLASQSKSD